MFFMKILIEINFKDEITVDELNEVKKNKENKKEILQKNIQSIWN